MCIVVIIAKIIAFGGSSEEAKVDKPKKLFKYAEKFLPTDIIKDNLNNHQAEINAALNSGIEEMNSVINTQIDGFFDTVEYNVDKFLDWHHSLKGDYSDLALFVAKKTGLSTEDAVANVLQEKLLGKDYKQRLDAIIKRLSKTYASLLNQHEKFVSETALKGVDTDLSQNAKILDTLGDEVARKLKANFTGAIGATASVSGLAIMAKLTPKLVAKIGAKLGAKVGGKFLAKIGTALSGSWTCGPFAPACAIGLWFISDASFNYIDEWLHRNGFKKEILNNINEVKENLKNSYKQQFNDSFVKFSQELQESYKNALVVEKKTIKEHIGDLNQTPEENNQKNNQ
ncbi:SEC15 family protein [Helicobacter pylori]|uniref:SEC15 family protein n=1 Tax=Helicobacter pylori TaxID=210 RepID=UPI002159CCF2|nr:SEC15 family protein [Helicobacter pylori]